MQDTQNRLREHAMEVQSRISQVIFGKNDVIDLMLVALLSGGHVLLEDLPGTGKTTLAKALARTLDCSFKRIQFTPDLTPADITGYNFFDQKEREFRFHPGPILAQIILADEINRAIPRTQASLLECMGEGQVTVDGQTMPLPAPFIVIATQNPVDLEGTFPLPEAQLDRFLMRLNLGYPDTAAEERMLLTHSGPDPLHSMASVMGPQDILSYRQTCQDVFVEDSVRHYILQISRATRSHPALELGASPRATLHLFRAVKTLAAMAGRDYVIPDDAKRLAGPVLAHRLVPKSQERLRGTSPAAIIEEVLRQTPVPVGTDGAAHA